jgi:perosamine synthetase
VNRQHGVACANGSAALDLAVAALGLGPGDEVIVPTFTIISSVQPIVKCGATPVLVDLDEATLTMRVDQVIAALTPRTKCIVVVHLYGLPADMQPLLDICKEKGIKLLEDAAEMHGQTYKGQPCGSFGDISIFSFYPNKHITTGEGGMCVTNDDNLAKQCRYYRNLCFDLSGPRFVHQHLGWNYRMTNMQAALGLAQMEKLDDHVTKKRAMGSYYQRELQNVPGIVLPPSQCGYAESIYWVFGVVLKDEVSCDAKEIMGRLGKRGVGTRPFFWCMHEQPVFKNMGLFAGNPSYPVSEKLARRGFYLPSGLGLSDEDMAHVVANVKEVMAEITSNS